MDKDQPSDTISGFILDYRRGRLIFEEYLAAVLSTLVVLALAYSFMSERIFLRVPSPWTREQSLYFWLLAGLSVSLCISFWVIGYALVRRRGWAYVGVWSERLVLVALLLTSLATKTWQWELILTHILPLIGIIDQVISIGRYIRSMRQ